MKKRFAVLICLLMSLAAAIALAGCGEVPEASEDIELRGYVTEPRAATDYYTTDELGDLSDATVYEMAVVVTNHSDEMYSTVNVEPVAYDADGNEMKDVFQSIGFDDAGMTSEPGSDPSFPTGQIGAGESVAISQIVVLADGAAAPDHVEFRTNGTMVLNTDDTTIGLEVTDVVNDGENISFTVTNNSDKDYQHVSVSMIVTDADGKLITFLISDHMNADGTDVEPLPAHESYDDYLPCSLFDTPVSPDANIEIYAEQMDQYF